MWSTGPGAWRSVLSPEFGSTAPMLLRVSLPNQRLGVMMGSSVSTRSRTRREDSLPHWWGAIEPSYPSPGTAASAASRSFVHAARQSRMSATAPRIGISMPSRPPARPARAQVKNPLCEFCWPLRGSECLVALPSARRARSCRLRTAQCENEVAEPGKAGQGLRRAPRLAPNRNSSANPAVWSAPRAALAPSPAGYDAAAIAQHVLGRGRRSPRAHRYIVFEGLEKFLFNLN